MCMFNPQVVTEVILESLSSVSEQCELKSCLPLENSEHPLHF